MSLDGGGNFVVVWRSDGQAGTYGSLFARRFNAAGNPLAAEFQVNTYTLSSQNNAVVSRDADGDFVAAWDRVQGGSRDVLARRFNAAGVAQGAELLVNIHTDNHQANPAVSHAPNGDFVIVWSSREQDGSDYATMLRRFSSAGVAQTGEPRSTPTPPVHSTASRCPTPPTAPS